jgi:hypothetical protein
LQVQTKVVCDRCLKTIDGLESVDGSNITATGGYYKRAAWKKFMDDNESIVCDACMHTDSRYLAIYGGT